MHFTNNKNFQECNCSITKNLIFFSLQWACQRVQDVTSIKAFVAGEFLRKYQQSLGKVLILNILVVFYQQQELFFIVQEAILQSWHFFSSLPGLVGKFTRESRNWVTLMVTSIFSILLCEKTVRKTRKEILQTCTLKLGFVKIVVKQFSCYWRISHVQSSLESPLGCSKRHKINELTEFFFQINLISHHSQYQYLH